MPLPFKFKIKQFAELSSTNTYAREQAALGAEEGLVFAADHQTAGRGQFERKWESPAGKNLTFSILLRPPLSPAQAPLITQIVCHSIAKVLEQEYKIPCQIKRPNDILVNGKKICGILVESSSHSPAKVDHVIIGVGLNVNEAPKGVIPEPICMKDITGQEMNLKDILPAILTVLEIDLGNLYANPA